ncbi:MAG: hypothetical protein ABIN58_09615, partial [candidate division WOR-3 bacterium]
MNRRTRLFATASGCLMVCAFLMMPGYVSAQAGGKPITLNFVSFAPAANVVEFQHIKKEFFDRV